MAFLEAMDSVGLDTCILTDQESIQADLNAVVDEYFSWTRSAEVQGQDDYDADSYSSDSDSTCSEHDTFSVGQDVCSPETIALISETVTAMSYRPSEIF